jgi:microsomal epoxide hydrolase
MVDAIGTSIRTYANNNRYPWTPSHDWRPAVEAPTGITFVTAGESPAPGRCREWSRASVCYVHQRDLGSFERS